MRRVTRGGGRLSCCDPKRCGSAPPCWRTWLIDYSWAGRFAEADALLPEAERVASRTGHHLALSIRWCPFLAINEGMRTGDLHASLAAAERAMRDPAPVLAPVFGNWLAAIHLYLGRVDRALERLTATMVRRPPFARGLAEGNLFVGNALAGRLDHARTLFAAVVPWLPTPGRRNVVGAWWTLETAVAGLALVGDIEHCGALYASTLAYIDTGFVCAVGAIGPGTPQLAAAIAAHAAGLDDKAHEHFEIAARQARELPFRILQPTVQYWFGRMLSGHADPVEQSRGRAMIESAASDFRSLEMVLHADLAERFLRSG